MKTPIKHTQSYIAGIVERHPRASAIAYAERHLPTLD
jgi:hypothetical protein